MGPGLAQDSPGARVGPGLAQNPPGGPGSGPGVVGVLVGVVLFTFVFCLTAALLPDLEAPTVAASTVACFGLWKYVEQSPVDAQASVLREARGRSGAPGAGQGSPTVFSEFAAARPALPDLPFSLVGRGLH
jgi:hypothetical protein